jgi:hypothetical protein
MGLEAWSEIVTERRSEAAPEWLSELRSMSFWSTCAPPPIENSLPDLRGQKWREGEPREKDERKPSAAVLCGGNNDGLMYHLARAQQRYCGVRR